MASDNTTMLLDEANVAAVRLMLGKLTDHDVIEMSQAASG